MGVYIKNLEKPKKCDDCPFYGYDERQSILFCRLDNEDIEQDLRDDCPLIEIDDTKWEWCHDCKEYDQEAHCCHRWTKVIRKTVEDVKESYKIVTCGECKHWHEGEWYNTCDKHIGHGFMAEHFCSYGERRADEGTIE